MCQKCPKRPKQVLEIVYSGTRRIGRVRPEKNYDGIFKLFNCVPKSAKEAHKIQSIPIYKHYPNIQSGMGTQITWCERWCGFFMVGTEICKKLCLFVFIHFFHVYNQKWWDYYLWCWSPSLDLCSFKFWAPTDPNPCQQSLHGSNKSFIWYRTNQKCT